MTILCFDVSSTDFRYNQYFHGLFSLAISFIWSHYCPCVVACTTVWVGFFFSISWFCRWVIARRMITIWPLHRKHPTSGILPGHFLKSSISSQNTGQRLRWLFFFTVRALDIISGWHCVHGHAKIISVVILAPNTASSRRDSWHVRCLLPGDRACCWPMTCPLRVNQFWHVLSGKWVHWPLSVLYFLIRCL